MAEYYLYNMGDGKFYCHPRNCYEPITSKPWKLFYII